MRSSIFDFWTSLSMCERCNVEEKSIAARALAKVVRFIVAVRRSMAAFDYDMLEEILEGDDDEEEDVEAML